MQAEEEGEYYEENEKPAEGLGGEKDVEGEEVEETGEPAEEDES